MLQRNNEGHGAQEEPSSAQPMHHAALPNVPPHTPSAPLAGSRGSSTEEDQEEESTGSKVRSAWMLYEDPLDWSTPTFYKVQSVCTQWKKEHRDRSLRSALTIWSLSVKHHYPLYIFLGYFVSLGDAAIDHSTATDGPLKFISADV